MKRNFKSLLYVFFGVFALVAAWILGSHVMDSILPQLPQDVLGYGGLCVVIGSLSIGAGLLALWVFFSPTARIIEVALSWRRKNQEEEELLNRTRYSRNFLHLVLLLKMIPITISFYVGIILLATGFLARSEDLLALFFFGHLMPIFGTAFRTFYPSFSDDWEYGEMSGHFSASLFLWSLTMGSAVYLLIK